MDLWAARLDRPLTESETAVLLERLPSRRRERLLRTDRTAWREPLCAYALLTLALRTRMGWDVLPQMAWSDRGKPFFPAHPEVCFSLSHTNGAVLAGVSVAPVGVDIEFDRPVGRRTMERLAGTADRAEFLRWWVCREAAAKRDGAGVAAVLRTEPILPPGVGYRPLEVFRGYYAGVCAEEAELSAVVRQCSVEELSR